MTTPEDRLSRLLTAAAPDTDGVRLEDVASTVRHRRRAREVGIATGTVLATAAVVVGMVVLSPRSPAPPTPPAVDLADAVPWTDAPATDYQPPTDAGSGDAGDGDAAACTASDVTAALGDGDGASGHYLTVLSFTNTAATPCVLSGFPDVKATEPGRPDVSATDGSWFPTGGTAVMQPGGQTLLGVETDTMCPADPDGTAAPDPYHHLAVTLPGGGEVGVDVPDGVDVTCGLKLTEFYAGRPGDAGPVDPLSELVADLELPPTFVSGEPLIYVARLTNPTDQAIALDRCPSYVETLTGPQASEQSYALACDAVGEIGPHRSVRFEMRLAVPADARTWLSLSSRQPPSLPVTVTWALAAPFDVSTTGTTTLVDHDGATAPSSATTASATGVLEIVGGPETTDGTTPKQGTAGTVAFTDTVTGATHTATAPADGTFSIDLPPGTYTVTGTEQGGSQPCSPEQQVTVPASGTSGIEIMCPVP